MVATKHALLTLAVLLLSATAFAQENYYYFPGQSESGSAGGREGFAVSYQYSNLDSFTNRTSTTNSTSTLSESRTDSGSTNTNLSGINLGFRSYVPGNTGYEFGIAYMQGSGSSDLWTPNTQLAQAYANITYSFGLFHLFMGPNFSDVMINNSFAEKDGQSYSPNLGGEAGIGLIKGGFLGQVGYELVHVSGKLQASGVNYQTDLMLSGLTAQLGYIF